MVKLKNPLWTPEELRSDARRFNHLPAQLRYEKCKDKKQCTAAGRRGGKTQINARKCVTEALENTQWLDWRGFLGAPTRGQAKDLYWNRVKRLLDPELIDYISESELFIRLVTNAEIHIEGLDRMERIEGQPWNWMCIDETDDCKFDEIEEHIFPMVADRDAQLIFSGVPNGLKYLYRLSKTFKFFTWKSADVFPLYMGEEQAERILSDAKARMDLRTYLQEFEASFETAEGRIYYCFDRNVHVKPGLKELYDPKWDLVLCFDFNRSPGICNVVQEVPKKGNPNSTTTTQIDEIHVHRNSNTPIICREILRRYGKHEGNVICDGDPSGGNKSTQAVEGSDWDLIRSELSVAFDDRLKLYHAKGQPSVNASINSVNSRLKTADGTISFQIDESCEYTIDDLETVSVLKGTDGEIDKSDETKTHHTDALRYYIHNNFPFGGGGVYVSELTI